MKPIVLLAAAAISLVAAAPASAQRQVMFANPAIAQRSCPNSTVVWVNRNSGYYHMPWSRWYGVMPGIYMCRPDARYAGYRQAGD